MKNKKYKQDIGVHFKKYDIDRCGLFIDNGFFKREKYQPARPGYLKGKNFSTNVTPSKCGLQSQSGYFDRKFISINLDKYSVKARGKPEKKWGITGPAKVHSTTGDYWGTFGGPVKAFSPLTKKQGEREKGLKTFLTNPGKKGGPGYIDITIGKYPAYDVKEEGKPKEVADTSKNKVKLAPFHLTFSQLSYFDDNPWLGNTVPTYKDRKPINKEGRFYPGGYPSYLNKFPQWKPDPYNRTAKGRDKVVFNFFKPVGFNRKYYSESTIAKNIKFRCNERTKEFLRPITYPQYNVSL